MSSEKVARIAVAGTLVVLLSASAGWTQCSSPPGNALSLTKTFDAVHIGKVCNSGIATTLYSGLHLDAGNWTDGYGLDEVGGEYVIDCHPNSYLSRLLTGAYIVREVEGSAIQFGQHRPVSGVGGFTSFLVENGLWWAFATSITLDEWEPECSTDSNAKHYDNFGSDNYIGLRIPGAYLNTAMFRAAIVAHEPTHEEVSHGDDSSCTNGKSCDDEYGVFNANTMHINFLYDAATTYRTELVGGVPARKVVRAGNQCKFIPRFADAEREEARAKAERDLNMRFAQAPPAALVRYGDLATLDAASGTPFTCASCDLGPHTFTPGTCDQTACNETLNPANVGVNESRRAACTAYNASVSDPFVTPDAVAIAKADLDGALPACLPTDAPAARAYCEAEKAAAATASDVDACGWLDAYNTPTVSHQACVEEFCQAKWNTSGGWPISQDPFGCMDFLCGGEQCGDTNEASCKVQFVIMEGDPDLYGALCRLDGCQKDLIDCLVALTEQDPPAWSYGQTIPPSCNAPALVCREAHELAMRVWMEFLPDILGPLHESLKDPRTTNPAATLDLYAAEFREAVTSGASFETRDRLARRLTSVPELVAALFNAAPGEFAWMFGRDGFGEVLGPHLAVVDERQIDPSALSAQGQQAFNALASKLAAAPGGQLPGAIGTIAFR